MTKGVVSEKRRQQARKHASRVWTCYCGKQCSGNGGKSSHRRACQIYRHFREGRPSPDSKGAANG